MNPDAPPLFDSLARNRAHARAKGDGGFLFRETGARLLERLSDINRGFPRVLEIGGRTPGLDRLPGCESHTAAPLIGPDEILDPALSGFDLIVSNLTLHGINDLPGFLIQTRRALRPDGLFIASLFGGETLGELRHAWREAELRIRGGISPRVAPFADIRDLGGLLQRAGFAMPLADLDRMNVTWETPYGLFGDLRAMGETNILSARSRGLLTPRLLSAVAGAYDELYKGSEGRITARFDIIWLTGWAPPERQTA